MYTLVALSRKGAVRAENQDNFWPRSVPKQIRDDELEHFLLTESDDVCAVLADGIGGHPGGGEAAERAIEAVAAALEGSRRSDPDARIRQAFAAAQQAVIVGGTTLIVGIVDRGFVHVGSIGDSRAYLAADGSACQVTIDDEDSLGYLTKWIGEGARQDFRPRVTAHPFPVGTRLVLASDGVFGPLSEAVLGEFLAMPGGIPLSRLVDAIYGSPLGAYDNFTIVSLENMGETIAG